MSQHPPSHPAHRQLLDPEGVIAWQHWWGSISGWISVYHICPRYLSAGSYPYQQDWHLAREICTYLTCQPCYFFLGISHFEFLIPKDTCRLRILSLTLPLWEHLLILSIRSGVNSISLLLKKYFFLQISEENIFSFYMILQKNSQSYHFGYGRFYMGGQSLAGTSFDSEASHHRHLAPPPSCLLWQGLWKINLADPGRKCWWGPQVGHFRVWSAADHRPPANPSHPAPALSPVLTFSICCLYCHSREIVWIDFLSRWNLWYVKKNPPTWHI